MPGTVVRFVEPLVAELVEDREDRASRRWGPGEVRLRTLYSGISAGTELTAYRGRNPYLSKRWNERRGCSTRARAASFAYPIDGWGYEEVGVVVEVGRGRRPRVALGDVVCGRGATAAPRRRARTGRPSAHAARRRSRSIGDLLPHRRDRPQRRARRRHPRRRDRRRVRPGRARPAGARQLARLNGGRRRRRGRDRRAGSSSPGELGARARRRLHRRCRRPRRSRTSPTGAAPTSRSRSAARTRALQEAMRADGVQLAGRRVRLHRRAAPTALFLGEEFHHNRIELVCSQISGVSRAARPPLGQAAAASSTLIRLCGEGRVETEPLISHSFRPSGRARRSCCCTSSLARVRAGRARLRAVGRRSRRPRRRPPCGARQRGAMRNPRARRSPPPLSARREGGVRATRVARPRIASTSSGSNRTAAPARTRGRGALGGGDGDAARHRLEHGEAEALEQAREHDRAGAAVERRQGAGVERGPGAGRGRHPGAGGGSAAAARAAGRLGAREDQGEPRSGSRARAWISRWWFLCGHRSPDTEDVRGGRGTARAVVVARVLGRIVRLDAVRDDRDALRCDAERRDDRVARACSGVTTAGGAAARRVVGDPPERPLAAGNSCGTSWCATSWSVITAGAARAAGAAR